MKNGYVYLCGAGCGEADLITVRGTNALKCCDAVIYDSLIDRRLLDIAPENSEKICVGKRAGRHSEKQENINKIIAQKALEGKCVVRLKGGDPLIFGRGGEEAEALKKSGIPFEFIPGITSSSAVPELAGIPVTHRNVSRSFHVITGHTADDALPENMAEFAKLKGTLVFLMGLKNLSRIAGGLMGNGMRPDTPAAVISNGGRKSESIIKASLSEISEKAKNAETPAVIVIGETASFDLASEKKSTVSIVGTKHFAAGLSEKLSRCGIKTEYPCELIIKKYADNAAFDEHLKNISEYTAVAFTSANAADIFFERIKQLQIDVRKLAHLKFAAIGSGTANALFGHGIFADIIPEKYTSAELGNKLAKVCGRTDRILIPRAERGSDELTKPLDAANIDYSEVKIYDVCAAVTAPCEVTSDFLVFGSSSGVRNFFENGFTVSEKTNIICIGGITAKTLESIDGRKCIVPEAQNTDGIAEIILKREIV